MKITAFMIYNILEVVLEWPSKKGSKDNSGFQKFGRTIGTKITCITKVKQI